MVHFQKSTTVPFEQEKMMRKSFCTCNYLLIVLDTEYEKKRNSKRLRPYHVESTGSRSITEVKQRRARSVLGWVTAWEYRVL